MKSKILKVLKWIGFIVLGVYIILLVIGGIHVTGKERTQKVIDQIHATKLTLSDVMGDNLPPDPGLEADKTIAGIDANNNGIRDDVELAIFKAYPKQAKTRAVLLQYALVLQIGMTNPLNEEIATTISQKDSRAYDCIGNIVPKSSNDLQVIKSYRDFVKNKMLNTTERKNKQLDVDNETRSFQLDSGCDIDLTILK